MMYQFKPRTVDKFNKDLTREQVKEQIPSRVSVKGKEFDVVDGCVDAPMAFETELATLGFERRSRPSVTVRRQEPEVPTTDPEPEPPQDDETREGYWGGPSTQDELQGEQEAEEEAPPPRKPRVQRKS
jgi:hypothetical protein